MRIEKTQCVIVATAVLHNICCLHNDNEAPANSSEMEAQISYVLTTPNNRPASTRSSYNMARRLLVENYFAKL